MSVTVEFDKNRLRCHFGYVDPKTDGGAYLDVINRNNPNDPDARGVRFYKGWIIIKILKIFGLVEKINCVKNSRFVEGTWFAEPLKVYVNKRSLAKWFDNRKNSTAKGRFAKYNYKHRLGYTIAPLLLGKTSEEKILILGENRWHAWDKGTPNPLLTIDPKEPPISFAQVLERANLSFSSYPDSDKEYLITRLKKILTEGDWVYESVHHLLGLTYDEAIDQGKRPGIFIPFKNLRNSNYNYEKTLNLKLDKIVIKFIKKLPGIYYVKEYYNSMK